MITSFGIIIITFICSVIFIFSTFIPDKHPFIIKSKRFFVDSAIHLMKCNKNFFHFFISLSLVSYLLNNFKILYQVNNIISSNDILKIFTIFIILSNVIFLALDYIQILFTGTYYFEENENSF